MILESYFLIQCRTQILPEMIFLFVSKSSLNNEYSKKVQHVTFLLGERYLGWILRIEKVPVEKREVQVTE